MANKGKKQRSQSQARTSSGDRAQERETDLTRIIKIMEENQKKNEENQKRMEENIQKSNEENFNKIKDTLDAELKEVKSDIKANQEKNEEFKQEIRRTLDENKTILREQLQEIESKLANQSFELVNLTGKINEKEAEIIRSVNQTVQEKHEYLTKKIEDKIIEIHQKEIEEIKQFIISD